LFSNITEEELHWLHVLAELQATQLLMLQIGGLLQVEFEFPED
jgi:hypothetical protein